MSAYSAALQNVFIRVGGDVPIISLASEGLLVTRNEFLEMVQVMVSALKNSGIRSGDRIVAIERSSFEACALFWACVCTNCLFCPMDPEEAEQPQLRKLKLVEPKLVFAPASVVQRISVTGYSVISWESPAADTVQSFEDWLEGADSGAEMDPGSPDLPAAILFTSSSTGEAKGVVHRNGSLAYSGQLVCEHFQWKAGRRFFNLAGHHTMSGLRNSYIAPFAGSVVTVFASDLDYSNVFEILEFIGKHKINYLGVGPIFLKQMLMFQDRIDESCYASLEQIICTGAPVSQDDLDAFERRFGVQVLNYYGLTETCGLCVGHTPDTAPLAAGSVGIAVGATLHVLDDGGTPVDDGCPGELVVGSPCLMEAYYDNPSETARMLREGRLYTGDIVIRRPDGHILLKGRKRNIIKTADTEVVYIEEVESCILAHPGVADAAIEAYISSMGDERMKTYIVPKTTVEESIFRRELKAYLTNKLGSRKIPSEFVFREKIPRSAMGKLLRRNL